MTPIVTVLVPTHGHSATLRFSVESALAQTVQDLEILIVGDGATDDTRRAARALEHQDARVRFFDFSKGERHGERSRHVALQEARGRNVCYLADDDLWLPEHVEHCCHLLESADFATTVRLMAHPSGEYEIERVDLGVPYVRQRLLAGVTNVPLCCASHTLRVYRELPEGWRPAPAAMSPPLHMWQQFMAQATCRAAAGTRVTSINFPDSWRTGWSAEARGREIAPIAARLSDPSFRHDLLERALHSSLDKWARIERHLHDIEGHVAYLQRQADAVRTSNEDAPSDRVRA